MSQTGTFTAVLTLHLCHLISLQATFKKNKKKNMFASDCQQVVFVTSTEFLRIKTFEQISNCLPVFHL